MFKLIVLLIIGINICVGCATSVPYTSPVKKAETDYLDEHAFRLKDKLERCWFLSGFYYLERYIPEDEYTKYYVTRLNKAQFELGSANYHIMHCLHRDYMHLEEIRRHIKNVESILEEVNDRLEGVDTGGVLKPLEDESPVATETET